MRSKDRKKLENVVSDTLNRALGNWDDIRFFLAIHRARSLSAAATTLGVTQPTCGRRLTALENGLGIVLFDRLPDGLRLTATGHALLAAAVRMESGAHDLALSASSNVAKLDGVVRIAMTEFTALAFVIPMLPSLRERYPRIQIELVIANAFADILGHAADCAIRWQGEGFRPTPAKVIAQKLGRVDWCLFGADSYFAKRGAPKDPTVLAGHDLVLYSDGDYPGYQWMMTASRGAAIAMVSPSIVCGAAAVSQGMGLGLFPKQMARLEPRLRALTEPIASGWAWLVVHPDLQRVPRIRAVMDRVGASLRDDLRAS